MLQDNYARYIWLISTIYRKGKITFGEIDRAWINASINDNGEHLPKRSFHRWRDAIFNNFGIIITCNRSDNYRYYIENSDELGRNNLMFSLINSMAINNISTEIKDSRKRILLEKVPSADQWLQEILEAMRDNSTLMITYEDPWRRHIEESTFEFEPYAIKIFKRRWYVIGKKTGIDKIEIYPLDRIKNLEITDNFFKYDEAFDGNEYFRHCYGIQTDQRFPPQKVVIKFDHNQRGYIRSLPLHHTQKEIETTDEYSVFEYYIKPTYDFELEILAQGESFEILEPEWMRQEMAGYGRTIGEMNKGL